MHQTKQVTHLQSQAVFLRNKSNKVLRKQAAREQVVVLNLLKFTKFDTV
jgi:hypothetical protein